MHLNQTRRIIANSILGTTLLIGGHALAQTPAPSTQPAVAVRAEEAKPLKQGDKVPAATLRKPDGSTVQFTDLLAAKPSIVIFYRGGWCPYCNTHLMEIAKIEPQLVAMGYQVLAISPDSPESLKATVEDKKFTYQLLSDADVKLIRAFGLAFKVDDPTIQRYKGFGIDLMKASGGQSDNVLPVPALYIIDKSGVIRFSHTDPDYQKRIDTAEVLKVAKGHSSNG